MQQSRRLSESSEVFSRAVYLTGATASGKTSLAVELALALGGEIVSMDSMAVYRHMDVGVAKPTVEERRGVPHHMIDVADPWDEYSTADFLRDSEKAALEIESRGKRAIFAGGTCLYLKTILFGVCDAPEGDPAIRAELAALAEREGAQRLWEELEKCDPTSAARLHPNDVKRVVRAIETYRLTGSPLSSLQQEFSRPPRVSTDRVFILTREREELYERINRRVEIMIQDGFLAEVERLLASGRELSRTSSQAVGYAELARTLRKEQSLEEAVARIQQFTRNFAKRQETWFRSFEKQGARRIQATGRTTKELCEELVGIVRNEGL